MGTLGGDNIFGIATRFQPTFAPTAQQINAFFGVDGLQSLFGGERGVSILVSGWFFDVTPEGVVDQEGLLLSYRDGIARTLVDNYGRVYPDCVMGEQYQQDPMGIRPAFLFATGQGGWAMSYRCVLQGL